MGSSSILVCQSEGACAPTNTSTQLWNVELEFNTITPVMRKHSTPNNKNKMLDTL